MPHARDGACARASRGIPVACTAERASADSIALPSSCNVGVWHELAGTPGTVMVDSRTARAGRRRRLLPTAGGQGGGMQWATAAGGWRRMAVAAADAASAPRGLERGRMAVGGGGRSLAAHGRRPAFEFAAFGPRPGSGCGNWPNRADWRRHGGLGGGSAPIRRRVAQRPVRPIRRTAARPVLLSRRLRLCIRRSAYMCRTATTTIRTILCRRAGYMKPRRSPAMTRTARSGYRSYDPGSGTYLGYDGLRHPCP